MNLIGRYVFREVLVSTVIVMGVLLVIFMSNQFAVTLGDAAADALPREAVFKVFGLQFLRYLASLSPVGILLGVLLALARLNRDSEMSALAACGIGPGRLLRPIGLLSLVLACGVAWLALIEAPAANLEIERIKFQAREGIDLGPLTAGKFAEIDGGSTVVRAREVDGNLWHDVFIQIVDGDKVVVVVAKEGERVASDGDGEMGLMLRDGKRYEGVPGKADFFVASFREHGIPIELGDREFEPALGSQTSAMLLAADDPAARAEFEWRMAAPVSLLILTLLAVPLGRSSPREGKYARVGLGLLVYMVYSNMVNIALVWVERGTVPLWLGSWWVHATLAVLALTLLARQTGFGTGRGRPLGVRHEPTG